MLCINLIDNISFDNFFSGVGLVESIRERSPHNSVDYAGFLCYDFKCLSYILCCLPKFIQCDNLVAVLV